MPNRFLLSYLLLFSLSLPIFAQTTQPTPNLVINPGFESRAASWPFSDSIASASAAIDDTVHHTGHHSLRLTNTSPFGPNVYFRASQTLITQPFTTYRLSCWVKGDSSGDCFIGGGPGWNLRKEFPQGTFDWRQVSTEWSTGPTADDFELILVTQSPTKSCWIDDVEFTPIRTDTAKLAALQHQFQSTIDQQKSHLAQVLALAQSHNESADPYVTLGTSIAQRFLTRITSPTIKQNVSWSTLQLEEISTVLTQTEDRINNQPQHLPGQFLSPSPAPVQIRNGVFYAPHQGQSQPSPIYFGGYGAFLSVFKDLPNFRSYGANLIQDGRQGPSSLSPTGPNTDFFNHLSADFQTTAKNNVKIDFLLSPHYFPAYAFQKSPDLHNGNIGFLNYNIDHPLARKVIEHWLRTVVPILKDQPALLSYCLSNEPAYVQSGKDPYSRPKWTKYLETTHHTIAALNQLYGTTYKSFADVPAPTTFTQPVDMGARRAYYDWCTFNQLNFADWHRWMNSIVKSIDPHALTHIKVIAQQQLDQGTIHLGNDLELECNITDLAGCDNFVGFDNNSLTSWPVLEFNYDLLNSFRNQPVFNSELHFIPDNFPPQHIPWENSRAILWQGALHHLGAATIWVWEEPGPGGLEGSIYLRPANIYAVGRALLDANRLSLEVTAINQSKPRVALLFSEPSIFWQPNYHADLMSLHTQLKLAGEKVTFVSDRQLAAGHIPDVNIILSARTTHLSDQAITGLQSFVSHRGKLLLCGDDDLLYNPYHQPRTLPPILRNSPHITSSTLLTSLHAAGINLTQLLDTQTHHPVAGIEYCIVPYNNAQLIPLINFTPTTQTIALPESIKGSAIDLLSGLPVDRNAVPLSPMVPMLLRIDPNPVITPP